MCTVRFWVSVGCCLFSFGRGGGCCCCLGISRHFSPWGGGVGRGREKVTFFLLFCRFDSHERFLGFMSALVAGASFFCYRSVGVDWVCLLLFTVDERTRRKAQRREVGPDWETGDGRPLRGELLTSYEVLPSVCLSVEVPRFRDSFRGRYLGKSGGGGGGNTVESCRRRRRSQSVSRIPAANVGEKRGKKPGRKRLDSQGTVWRGGRWSQALPSPTCPLAFAGLQAIYTVLPFFCYHHHHLCYRCCFCCHYCCCRR